MSDASLRPDAHTAERERALAEALREVAAELCLIDLIDLVTFVRLEKHPTIEDLVSSSLELFFAPTALRYGWGAEADLGWDRLPSVTLDMEFRHAGVTAFFRLVLRDGEVGVSLNYMAFDAASENPATNTARLVAALADARARSRGNATTGMAA